MTRKKGAVFVDPAAEEPYLFHLALVTVDRADGIPGSHPVEPPGGLLSGSSTDASPRPATTESRLVGLIQTKEGNVEESPVEHLLLLRGVRGFAPSRVPLAALARRMTREDGGLRARRDC